MTRRLTYLLLSLAFLLPAALPAVVDAATIEDFRTIPSTGFKSCGSYQDSDVQCGEGTGGAYGLCTNVQFSDRSGMFCISCNVTGAGAGSCPSSAPCVRESVSGNASTHGLCTPQVTPPVPANTTGSPNSGAVTNNGGGSNSGVALINPLKVDTVPEFLALILAAVVNLGSIILVLMLVYVGFLFVVAQGNEEKLQNAKSALLWTVVGGLVLLGAQAISLVIQATVGSLQ